MVAVVAGGEVDRDPGQRRFGGELLVELHVVGAEQGDVVGAVGPGVGDHVGDVVVDRLGPGGVQAAEAVGRARRRRPWRRAPSRARPRRRGSPRRTSPAVRTGPRCSKASAAGTIWENWPGLNRGWLVHLVVLLGVLVDRRRGVGVGDRHGGPAAVDARLEQRALAVGPLELLGTVAADRVRLVLAVGGRLVAGHLLRVVRRARLHPVPGAGRRSGFGVGGVLEGGALVDPDHAADRTGNRGRRAGRQGQLRVVRVNVLTEVGVVVHAGAEGALHLGDRTAGLHVHPAGQGLGDLEAFRAEPVLHRGDGGLGRGVTGVELRVGQPVAVAGAGRVRDRLQGGHGAGFDRACRGARRSSSAARSSWRPCRAPGAATWACSRPADAGLAARPKPLPAAAVRPMTVPLASRPMATLRTNRDEPIRSPP